MPVMTFTTILLNAVSMLGAGMIEAPPPRNYMWAMIFQIIFMLACVGVSVKWTKKTHQD